jgi:hypothetical protein
MEAAVTGLPPLSPQQQQKMDQFYAGCAEMLDRYIHGVEMDMNRHAVKHGPMPVERMVFDMTRILATQVNKGELNLQSTVGMLVVGISRAIEGKRKGKG